jgi:alpha 1,3-glucosidase
VGSGLVVVTFLDHESHSIRIEFPSGLRWFNYRMLAEVNGTGHFPKFDGGRTAVFIRSGTIIPTKAIVRTSSGLMFWDPFGLIVALDNEGRAEGQLYLAGGETFSFALGGFVHQGFVFDGKQLSSVPLAGTFCQKYDVVISHMRITG